MKDDQNIGENIATLAAEFADATREVKQRQLEIEQYVVKAMKRASASGMAVTPQLDIQSIVADPAFGRIKSESRNTGHGFDLGELSIKAMVNAAGDANSNFTTFNNPPEHLPMVLGQALRPVRLLDVLPSIPVDRATIDYPQLNWSGDADYQIEEGDQKAEMFFDGSLKTAQIATIAVHTTASAQVLDDVPQLQATIQRVMASKVATAVEIGVVTGSGTQGRINGLYHQATSILTGQAIGVERIGSAIVTMENTGYVVNLIALNPADWFAIQMAKDSQGRYIYGNPASPAAPILFNKRVVTSLTIPVGHALIGDTNQTNILDRMQPTIFISRDHENYRTRNLVLILIETRVGFTLYDTAAFRKLDISGTESDSA